MNFEERCRIETYLDHEIHSPNEVKQVVNILKGICFQRWNICKDNSLATEWDNTGRLLKDMVNALESLLTKGE